MLGEGFQLNRINPSGGDPTGVDEGDVANVEVSN